MVPQLRRENSLLLWNVFDLNTPVHTFVGHDDVVLEFQWRKQKEGEFRAGCSLSPVLTGGVEAWLLVVVLMLTTFDSSLSLE